MNTELGKKLDTATFEAEKATLATRDDINSLKDVIANKLDKDTADKFINGMSNKVSTEDLNKKLAAADKANRDKLDAAKEELNNAITNASYPKFNSYHRRILLLSYFFGFDYGLCVLQIFIFLNGAYFNFSLSYIAVACFEGLLHCRICTMSPNGFLPSVVTSFWVLILLTISVQ